MIVVLHPMGGDPASMLQMFSGYRGRARFILPYGHPYGGAFVWFDSVSGDVPASLVAPEVDRIASAIRVLVAVRPTRGKPIVVGFSQGGMVAFAFAVMQPEMLAAAFPISGMLPPALYPSTTVDRPSLPRVTAFHGASDLAVPTESARRSIAVLRNAGYVAELHEYAGVEHDIAAIELREVMVQLERAGHSPDR